jgi:MoaA/NifB/PqqE/SkfB family radical SAM enzyme
MLPSELYQQLQKTYKIICFVDLADITQSPDSVFKLFTEHHKIIYEENERLVFYTNQTPDVKLLEHIQKAASVIDISNCFILICCPHKLNLGGNIDSLQQILVDCESTILKNNYAMPATMCGFPFSHLEIDHQGVAKPCCVFNDRVGQVPTQSINEIFYSAKMRQLRNDFLNGTRPAGCSVCWANEYHGHVSHRQANLKLYESKLYSKWITAPAVYSLDLKPGNVCNFKCRICNSRFSSLYAGEQLANSDSPKTKIKIQNLINGSRWFENDEKFIQEFEEFLNQIENLDFYGGEPFLLKNLYRVLNKAVELNRAQHIRLHFNTNGSIFAHHLIDTFKKFKQIDLAISVDNIGPRFELERGGSWQEVAETIKKLKHLPHDQINVYLYTTVNIQNVFYLDEIYAWAQTHGLNIVLNFLLFPQFLSIAHMTPEAKELVITKFQHSRILELQNISTRVKQSPGSDGQEFRDYMQKLDNWRNENFNLTHSEIANAMRYVL